MTRLAGNPRAPTDDWNAEALRLSVFLAPGIAADPSNWWGDVTHAEPENSEIKPRQGVRVDSGDFGDGLLIMQFQLNRVDWIFGNRPNALGDPMRRNLGQRLPVFLEAIVPWLAHCPRVNRLAFGASLIFETHSREDAYHFLSNYLNFDLEPESSSDFGYQINRGRSSRTLPDLWINRLTKWSAIRQVTLVGNLIVGENPTNLSLSSTPNSHGAKLELDINTSGERTEEFLEGSIQPLYSELVQLGVEIIRDGDSP
jgi:hypothetical protein